MQRLASFGRQGGGGPINLRASLGNTDEPNIQFLQRRQLISHCVASKLPYAPALKEPKRRTFQQPFSSSCLEQKHFGGHGIASGEASAPGLSPQHHAAPQGRSQLEVDKSSIATLQSRNTLFYSTTNPHLHCLGRRCPDIMGRDKYIVAGNAEVNSTRNVTEIRGTC